MTKIGKLKTIALIKRQRSQRTSKKNSYKKTLHHLILNTTDKTELIHNLSDMHLSQSYINLLSKVLGFIPTLKPTSIQEIDSAFQRFRRRMHLKYFHRKTPRHDFNHLRIPSTWEPPIPDNTSIHRYLEQIYFEINQQHRPFPRIDNLSREDKIALHDLCTENNVTIKPADKGGKIVIWDSTSYLREAHRQLNDRHYYVQLDHNPVSDLIFEISTFVTFLYQQHHIDYQTSTSNLSKYIDYYLKPIVKQIPSYIQDTTHFLRKIKEIADDIPCNSFLVTFDVKSLYTNIPHDEGINVCISVLQAFYGSDLPLSVKHLRQILHFILQRNYFQFIDNFYLQTHGTAMGSPFASNYANIFMDSIERHILNSAPGGKKPLVWFRFIDDIFCIWIHGVDLLQIFFEHMNSTHPTIQFEMSHSVNEIPFLDVLILNRDNTLHTTLYKKPTDVPSLLHSHSFHPPNCKAGIIYSQALRYRRSISNDDDLDFHLQQLSTILIKRGYNIGLINKLFSKVRPLSRDDLLQPHSRASCDILPFIIPFNLDTARIGRILHEHWHIIQEDEDLRDIASTTPIVAFKRNTNIKDLLVHTKFTSQDT